MSAEIARHYSGTLIRHTAKELAGAFYDENRSPRFRAAFPSQRQYVKTQWPYFVPAARESLATALTNGFLSEYLRDQIYEGLTEDFEKRHIAPGISVT